MASKNEKEGAKAAEQLPARQKEDGEGKNVAAGQDGMSISGHLSELKSRLTWIILALVLSIVLCAQFVDWIVEAFIGLGEGFNFVYIAPAELVTCYVKIVLIMALVISAPVILYQLWGFIKPALEQSEKRMGFLALLGGTGFFLLGVVFAYLVAVPFTINFFVNFDNTGLINAQISFESYINFVLTTLVTFGLVFEMPMLTLFLSQLGIVKPAFLVKTRKYAILVIFIVAAVITPPDVVSQVTIAVPMILLYEISILVCKVIVKRKESRSREEEAAAGA